MNDHTAFERSHQDLPEQCTCDRETDQTTTYQFQVAPAAGGGTTAWDLALGRLLARLVLGPVHCVVITQDPNPRYAQVMIGHGRAHLEASSNQYLRGDFRLGASEELALRMLGFDEPDLDRVDHPLNWCRDEDTADPFEVAHLLGTVLHEVMGLEVYRPITIDVFGAASPCAACTWGDEEDESPG